MILYSTNQPDIDAHYVSRVTSRQSSSTFQATFTDLYISYSYNISAFIIDERSGLPFPLAATHSRVVQFSPVADSCGKFLVSDLKYIYQQIKIIDKT